MRSYQTIINLIAFDHPHGSVASDAGYVTVRDMAAVPEIATFLTLTDPGVTRSGRNIAATDSVVIKDCICNVVAAGAGDK